MTTWIDADLVVDAVFSAAGDECASGMMRIAQLRGLQVPKDIAVIGYDDSEGAKTASPPLTTIRQPWRKMADTAYDLASDDGNAIAANPTYISFDPELVVRESA
jgi:LacI family transcriptional regulator